MFICLYFLQLSPSQLCYSGYNQNTSMSTVPLTQQAQQVQYPPYQMPSHPYVHPLPGHYPPMNNNIYSQVSSSSTCC